MFFVDFVGTASNTVLRKEKKTLSRNNSNTLKKEFELADFNCHCCSS